MKPPETPDRPAIVNVRDVYPLARERLDDAAWAYFCGGAGDEITLRDNEAAWQALRLLPRLGRDLAGGHTRLQLLGRTCAHPIVLAPVAYLGWAHADGERGSALAAAAQGAGFVLSGQSGTDLDSVARLVRDEPGRGPLWFQVSPGPDRQHLLALAARAAAAGYEALVLTLDAPLHGVRDRERAMRSRRPAHIEAVHRPAEPEATASASHFEHASRHGIGWHEVAGFIERAGMPVLVKGVLHADDARQALTVGAAGIVVSNHGGRTLDGAIATADALPSIAQALKGRLPVLVDGGIRRGTDVLKALALGADAVMVGRPHALALAAGGAMGVARWLRLLRDEFEIAMALSGCATLQDIDASLLWGARGRV